jgi:hypothetical protein
MLASLLWPLRYVPEGVSYAPDPEILRVWGTCQRGRIQLDAILLRVASYIIQPHNPQSRTRPDAVTVMWLERVGTRMTLRHYWSMECAADSFTWQLVSAQDLVPHALPNVPELKSEALADTFRREWQRMRFDAGASTFVPRYPIRPNSVSRTLIDLVFDETNRADTAATLAAKIDAALTTPYFRSGTARL